MWHDSQARAGDGGLLQDREGDVDRQDSPGQPWHDSRIYDVLRAMAHQKMCGEQADHVLQTTALVNEAWLKISGTGQDSGDGSGGDGDGAEGRLEAFYFEAARAMRYVLIEESRKRKVAKRGGGDHHRRVTLDTGYLIAGHQQVEQIDYLALHEALKRLEKAESRAGKIVELRFFGGMTMKQIADLLGVSLRAVEKDWAFARAWLRTSWGMAGSEGKRGRRGNHRYGDALSHCGRVRLLACAAHWGRESAYLRARLFGKRSPLTCVRGSLGNGVRLLACAAHWETESAYLRARLIGVNH